MNINKMNKRIELFKKEIKNGLYKEEELIPICKVWASINNLKRTEKYNKNNILVNVKNIEFITRYNSKFEDLIEENTFIKFNNRFYNVYSIDNIYFNNKFIIFRTTEEGEEYGHED